jgi:hypothetical protein
MARIEASGDINSVYEQIDAILKQIVEHKVRKQTLLRSTIQSQQIREEEIEQDRLRTIQEEEDARRRREEDGEKAEDGASADDNKSGGKTGRSVA